MNRYEQRLKIMHDLGILKDELTEKYLTIESASEGDEYDQELIELDDHINLLEAAIREIAIMNDVVDALILDRR